MSEKAIYFEDIMKALDEENFDDIEKNAILMREMMVRYHCALLEVETKFKVLDNHFSLMHEQNPINSIKSRLKHPRSIIQKLRRYHLPVTIESAEENLHDIAGVRIICSFIDDIYTLAECFINQDDITLIEMKDYIKHPKDNGYRSLHLIVEIPIFLHNEKRMMKAEVQMRTIAMDFWASLEHKIRYKKEIDDEELERISKELYECARLSNELDLRMQAVRKDIQESQKEKSNSNMFAKILAENWKK